jgi:zinc protease
MNTGVSTKFTRALFAGLFVLSTALTAPSAFAQTGQIPDPPEGAWTIPANVLDASAAPLGAVMPVDPSIIIGELDNGLRYFIRENPYPVGRADLRLAVKVGSLLEDDDQLGIAHFVEHMAFNGTARYEKQALIEALESFGMRFGAHINAYTSFDETVYMLTIPTDEEIIVDIAFEVLEDWAGGVAFEGEEIDKERGVVIEEWRLRLGAGTRVNEVQFPILFGGSQYAKRLPIGTEESLQTFTHDVVRRFYGDWYRPDLMAVIAVGDFDKNETEQRIIDGFGGLSNPADERPRITYDIPEHDETLFGVATDPEMQVEQVQVFHKMPIRPQGTHGSYRQTIIENLYGAMLNRRLRELAQQPDAPFLGAGASQGIFVPTREVYMIGAAVAPGGLERGLEALFAESARIAQQGFAQTEFDREKSTQLRSFERLYTEKATQASEGFVEEFQRAFLENESVPGIDYEWELYQRFMPEITLDEVNAVGGSWVSGDNRVVLVTAPESSADSLPSEEDLLAVLDGAGAGRMERYVDTVVDRPLLRVIPSGGSIAETTEYPEVGVTEWKLGNGATVVLKPTDFRQDQILLRAVSPGGTSLASDPDHIAALTAVNMISASGYGGFSPRQITNMMSDKVVDVAPRMEAYWEGFTGGASPRDLQTMFELLYLKFNFPRSDPVTFKLITDQMRAQFANDAKTPEAVLQEETRKTMTQDHFRRRSLTLEIIEEMDMNKSFDFYTDRYADASDFTFVFVGNFDLETIEPLVRTYIGTLPTIDREESWADEGVRYPTGVIEKTVYAGLEPKSLTNIWFTGVPPGPAEGGDEVSDAEQNARARAMGAVTSILEVRLRNVLREDLGGTYGVRVSGQISRIPNPEYSVSISFGSDPERADELIDFVYAELEKLKESGVTEQEIANVKAQARRSYETNIRENGYWLNRLVRAYQGDGDPSSIDDYMETVEALTPEAVHEAANTYIDFSNMVRITLMPEGAQRTR